MTNDFDEKKEHLGCGNVLVLLLIIVFTVAIRFPALFEPWGGDQGVYGYIASGMLDGKVPYRDMYTSTGYGVFFTYTLFFKLFGDNMMALHLGDLLSFLSTVILVYFITRLLYGNECAAFAGIVASLFGSGQAFSSMYDMKGAWGTYWQLAQRETFMTPLIAAAIFISIFADRKKKLSLFFLVGILLGLAVVFKLTAIGMVLILALYLIYVEIFRNDGAGMKYCVYKISTMALGFIVIQLPFLNYFWMHDSLDAMYKAVFVHTSIYAKLSRGNIMANAFQGNTYILLENLTLWLFSFLSMIYLMAQERKRENYLVIAWTVGTLLMIWGQGKFFGYHYILIIAPFSVLTGFGIKQFLKVMSSWKASFLSAGKNVAQMCLWIFLLGNLIIFLENNYDYYRWHALYLSGEISKKKYYKVFNEYPLHMYSFRSDYDVVTYLRTYAEPEDSLRTINGGGDTIINYLSGLKSPTRFTSTWYLFNKHLYFDPLTTQLRQEFIEGVKKEKPDYILLIYFSLDELQEEYGTGKFNDMLQLITFIQKEYMLEKSFRDSRTLYKRI